MATLEERGYVQYDYDAEVVLDRHALDYYEPSGKQATGALNKIESLPKTVLKAELLKVAYINAPSFYELIIARFPTLFHQTGIDGRSMADASWNGDLSMPPSRSREPSTEEEKEQEPESEFEVPAAEVKKANSEW